MENLEQQAPEPMVELPKNKEGWKAKTRTLLIEQLLPMFFGLGLCFILYHLVIENGSDKYQEVEIQKRVAVYIDSIELQIKQENQVRRNTFLLQKIELYGEIDSLNLLLLKEVNGVGTQLPGLGARAKAIQRNMDEKRKQIESIECKLHALDEP
jgi:hypothetical protein